MHKLPAMLWYICLKQDIFKVLTTQSFNVDKKFFLLRNYEV